MTVSMAVGIPLVVADKIREPAVVPVIQVGQVVIKADEVVANTDLEIVIDVAIDAQPCTLAIIPGLVDISQRYSASASSAQPRRYR